MSARWRTNRTLDNASAAALPLTAITARELLFHRLGVEEGGNAGDTLLIVGAAGGVGSILTQLASKLTAMTVIGTASRPESQQWVREAGAHHVIDHSKPFRRRAGAHWYHVGNPCRQPNQYRAALQRADQRPRPAGQAGAD